MKKIKAIVAGVGFAVAGSASAVPLYTDWDVDVRSAFMSFSPVGPSVATPAGSEPVSLFSGTTGQDANAGEAFTRLSWGFPFEQPNQSSLKVSPDETELEEADALMDIQTVNLEEDVLMAADFGATGTITHNNFPISSPSLTDAFLRSEVRLTSIAPGTPFGPVDDFIALDINFFETPNAGDDEGNCAGGGVTGVGVNINGCADIFAVSPVGATLNEAGQLVRELGTLGDPSYTYTALISISGAVPLSPTACGEVNIEGPCIGFLTEENNINVAGTSIAIVAQEVPAPAPIMALGAGLLMLAGLRRRRV